eukprot:1145117-Pelagomonas_calceolata.AAC.1
MVYRRRSQKQRRLPFKTTERWPAHERKKFIKKRIQCVVVLIHESDISKDFTWRVEDRYGTAWEEALESGRRGPESKEA